MKSGPARFSTSSGDDTILQPEVLAWMDANKWTGAHVVWHAVRGCTDGSAAGLLGPLGFPNICKDYPVLIPSDQICKTAGDGYQFLVFHRHMLQTLKQLWPMHAATSKASPSSQRPRPSCRTSGTRPTQPGALRCLPRASTTTPSNRTWTNFRAKARSVLRCSAPRHQADHRNQRDRPRVRRHPLRPAHQWSRGASSPHGLNNGQVNVTNYMFWKLSRLDRQTSGRSNRVAKGITTDTAKMAKYKMDMTQACNEMDIEEAILKQTPGSGPTLDCPPDVDETGDFHYQGASDLRVRHEPLRELPRPVAKLTVCIAHPGWPGLEQVHRRTAQAPVERRRPIQADRTGRSGQELPVLEGIRQMRWTLAACPASPNKPCNTATMPPAARRSATLSSKSYMIGSLLARTIPDG